MARLFAALVAAAAATASAAAPAAAAASYTSAAGNPLYGSDVAVEVVGWNFCNEALAPPQFPDHPSPRWADCAAPGGGAQLVSAAANALGPGDAFPMPGLNATRDANAYAVQKELFHGALCSRPAAPAAARSAAGANYSFTTVMFKSGNMNVNASVCPETVGGGGGRRRRAAAPPAPSGAALAPSGIRFNNLLMNQPLVQVTQASRRAVPYGGEGEVGFVSGTYDVDPAWTPAEIAAVQGALAAYTQAWVAFRFAEVDGESPPPAPPQPPALLANKSYVAAVWWRNVTSGGMVFLHLQETSAAAPWLMNYLKLMDASGVGGGYDWSGSGDMYGPIPAYLSQLRVTYTVLQRSKGSFGGLYVPCHGGCWKINGEPCDGDLDSDITRYICFIAESGSQGCSKTAPHGGCPPFHILSGSAEKVFPNDTARFPYECYSGHCAPGACDPYSNPGPQELMMLLPCSEWAEHGYPTSAGEMSGRPLVLDVGAIGARVALSGVEPPDIGAAERARRGWAPLPDLSTLPPYPGWTRSFVGFDFGQEQPSPGLVRYEFTQVDIGVLADSGARATDAAPSS